MSKWKAATRVSWFELFYDLIMVAAVGEAAHVFLADPTWETTFLVVAASLVLFTVWFLVTLAFNYLVLDTPLERVLVLVQMMAISVAALSLGDSIVNDVVGYVAVAVAFLTVAAIYALRHNAQNRLRRPVRIIIYTSIATAVLFAISAALTSPLTGSQSVAFAPVFIVIGLAVVLLPTVFLVLPRFYRSKSINHDHLIERFGLFVIIVIGESFVSLLASLGSSTESPNPFFFVLLFIFAYSVWLLYFKGIEPLGLPVSVRGIQVWLFGHALLIASLVAGATAVTDYTLGLNSSAVIRADGSWTPLPFVALLLSLVIIGAGRKAMPQRTRWSLLVALGVVVVLFAADIAAPESINSLMIALSIVVVALAALFGSGLKKPSQS